MRRSIQLRVRAPREVLGLHPHRTYTSADIKDAFHAKAKSLHPDAGGDAEQFKELNNAYEALRGKSSSPQHAGNAPKSSAAPHGEDFTASGRAQGWAHVRAQAGEARRRTMYYERYNDGGERRTWDYGDGATYANTSTRGFYRPYSSNYADPQATGFTQEEIRRAQLATYAYIARRLVFNVLIYGLFFYALYNLWRGLQLRKGRRETGAEWHRMTDDPSRPQTNDDEPANWREHAMREQLLRTMTPRLREHWTDAQKESYLRKWNADYAEREARLSRGGDAGGRTSTSAQDSHRAPPQRQVVPVRHTRINNKNSLPGEASSGVGGVAAFSADETFRGDTYVDADSEGE